jgi:hypothetical protein
MLNIKKEITYILLNLPGFHTNRKIVVIESDDWGGIRMPSQFVKLELGKFNMKLENDAYSLYDNLATAEDLEKLFEVLCSVKDSNGKFAKLTANTNVANPNFQLIKDSGFNDYFYEPFTSTLERSKIHNNSFQLWRQGINLDVFHPQFHGREHVNVHKWLNDLKINHANVRLWFDLGTYGTSYLVDNNQVGHYMTAFDSVIAKRISFYNQSIIEGLNLFEEIFGYRSESFISTTYCWPKEIEATLFQNGIRYLQGIITQKYPIDDGDNFRTKINFQGNRSKAGLLYLIRNAFFEPSINRNFNWIEDCLKRIEIAFLCHKPVTISMHRLNFIGSLCLENRSQNLLELKTLLKEIIKRWPNIEFMSSDELGRLIEKTNINV